MQQPLGQNQRVVIALFACLTAWLIWQDRLSWQQSHQNESYKTTIDQPDKKVAEITPEERIAKYTLWLAILTGCLVGVAGIQGYFLLRSDKTARIAANAADLSAKAAIGVELPILIIDRMNLWRGPGMAGIVNGIPPEVFRPIVVFKNIGRTAAELTSGCMDCEVVPRLPETPVYTHTFPFVPGTLLIEEGRVQLPFGDYSVRVESGDIEAITAETSFIWFYGYLNYSDFLGFPHQMRFCAKWEAVNASGSPRGFVLDTETPKAYLRKT